MNASLRFTIPLVLALSLLPPSARGQIEYSSPGNLRGIRVDGELMAFDASIRAVVPAATPPGAPAPGGRGGRGQTVRENGALVTSGALSGEAVGGRGGVPIAGATYRASFKEVAPGAVEAEVQINSTAQTPAQGVFFALTVPSADYTGGTVQLIAPVTGGATPATLTAGGDAKTYQRATAKGMRFVSRRRQLEVEFATPLEVVVKDVRTRNGTDFELSFPLCRGDLTAGQDTRATFTIKATGEVDKSPAHLTVDWSRPGRNFAGIGGNFRIQSPADAAQIDYNLANLRVAWGRVAMPLDRWQPDENADPIAVAKAGPLNANVRESMEIAQTLARKNIPIIASIWSVPRWALAATAGGRGQRSPLNPVQWDKLAQSIGSYLEFLKQTYGAEPVLFSFNESDIGINVLQTPQEHADTIKRLGAYFASRGLKTRLLLGDTGNPRGDKFIDVAAADPAAAKYIGAVSFHSWGSGTVEQYAHFADAARRLGVPLLVGEGGLDPSAHQYRAVFLEPWFCAAEIAQYVEICRVAEPLSILHWQLTADYSVLTGGGDAPLQPAQRFWQLKQLGMTSAEAVAVPVACDQAKVVACAFADRGGAVVHLVNNGAARTATVSGLPAGVKEMRVFVTDQRRGMQETGRVPVTSGTATVHLDPMSFTSLAANP